MTRLAALDLRRGRYVAHSSSLTGDGMWIANGAFVLLDEPADDRELGAAVRRMLDASRTGVPTPDLRGGPSAFAPVLDALGLRSFASYAKGTRHVDVEGDADVVLVEPHPQRRGQGGLRRAHRAHGAADRPRRRGVGRGAARRARPVELRHGRRAPAQPPDHAGRRRAGHGRVGPRRLLGRRAYPGAPGRPRPGGRAARHPVRRGPVQRARAVLAHRWPVRHATGAHRLPDRRTVRAPPAATTSGSWPGCSPPWSRATRSARRT